MFWLYAAQLRTRYQLAVEPGDGGQLLAIMMMAIGPAINNYAFQNLTNLDRILDRMLEWDRKAPNPYRDQARSADTDAQIKKQTDVMPYRYIVSVVGAKRVHGGRCFEVRRRPSFTLACLLHVAPGGSRSQERRLRAVK